MTIKYFTLLILLITFLSCDNSVSIDDSREDATILTDKDFYVARHDGGNSSYSQFEFTLIAEFTNQTSDTVYLSRCFPDSATPIYGVELVGRDEYSGYSRAWGCVGHDNHFEIAPGNRRIDTLRIAGPNMWNRYGEAIGVMEGIYRLNYDARLCRPDEFCSGIDSIAYSNKFHVQLE